MYSCSLMCSLLAKSGTTALGWSEEGSAGGNSLQTAWQECTEYQGGNWKHAWTHHAPDQPRHDRAEQAHWSGAWTEQRRLQHDGQLHGTALDEGVWLVLLQQEQTGGGLKQS